MEDLLVEMPEKPLSRLEQFFAAQAKQVASGDQGHARLTMHPRVVLIGAPESSISSQAPRLAQHFKVPCITPESALSIAAQKDAQLKALLDQGKDVPSDMVSEAVFAALADAQSGWILAGYPRTDLEAFALRARTQPSHVVEFAGRNETTQSSALAGIREVFRATATRVDPDDLPDD